MNKLSKIIIGILLLMFSIDLIDTALNFNAILSFMSTALKESNEMVRLLFINSLINHLALVLIIIGLLLNLKNKNTEINKWLKFSIFIYSNLFIVFIFIAINNLTKTEFYKLKLIINISLAIGLMIFYSMYSKLYYNNLNPKTKETVSKKITIRLLNYIIDSFIIIYYSYYLYVYFTLYGRNIEFIYIVIVYSIIYYFTLELLFRQTTGKLFTNTIIFTRKRMIPSIITRTLSRQIPFEPLSFIFGKQKRWHDLISDTELISEKNE